MGLIQGLSGIVTSSLLLSYDIADKNSYVGSGTSILDLSGNNYTGTLTNGPTFDTGNGGNILFDGTNDYIDTSLVRETPVTSPFTYQIIFKNNENANYMGLMGRSSFQVSGISIAIMFTNRLMISLNGASANSEPEFDYTNNVISMGTFVFNNRTITAYRNTTNVYTGSIAFNVVTNTNGIRIGSDIQGGWTYANKNVYSVKVYNKALTVSEVEQNFNAQKSRFGL
jgi:hypothetical protein